MSAGLFALMSKKGREDRRLKELRDAFDAADKDKDGQLTSTEWYGVLKQTGVEVSK
jgi:Ca2+-binding EF-hand superfamily protein